MFRHVIGIKYIVVGGGGGGGDSRVDPYFHGRENREDTDEHLFGLSDSLTCSVERTDT